MDEAYVRREVYRYLRILGYWPTRGRDASTCPRCKSKILPPIGRPDLLALSPSGLSRVLEVKVVNMAQTKSFSLDEVTEEQVRWLDAWAAARGLGYLAIGTVAEKRRSLWVID